MNRMRVRLWLLVVLVLLVGPGLVHARPAADEHAKVGAVTAQPSALGQAWSWIVSIFGNAGSFIDPLGDPHSIPAVGTISSGAGSFIDPLGGGQ